MCLTFEWAFTRTSQNTYTLKSDTVQTTKRYMYFHSVSLQASWLPDVGVFPMNINSWAAGRLADVQG